MKEGQRGRERERDRDRKRHTSLPVEGETSQVYGCREGREVCGGEICTVKLLDDSGGGAGSCCAARQSEPFEGLGVDVPGDRLASL